ncbi:JmjC domain-containing protein/WRC domain-containing protein/zf-4CXXC_R1 domain-containing protein [Cephalotus follicularis]|uniref:JmjC domain-containing protein/WRC domain-containing protein/zf-4CXXC_R1 domain-containing protein n=1 Tax=Cephalotus follicularis TaxID=3775 RepID=A0A1Q3D3G7_CEPFO|nr:JmjC domain-containing protein/WRC domain-containing protein/zf-4CXXC_R1 domain-containing protein [Cephalotus follicularis]
MDNARSASGNGEENVGIPDDLRCKRSDGKQWRCTAMSMPDKTVCEKHYIQAKRRAANSALRASLKKAKRKTLGESDIYLESKSDDFDMPDLPPVNSKGGEHHLPMSGKKYKDKASKNQIQYSPETPSMKGLPLHNSQKSNDDSQGDVAQFEENWRSYKTSPLSVRDSSRNRSQRSFDTNAMMEYSDASTDFSEDTSGQACHQCRRNDRDRVTWCLRCDRRGYCDSCISTWYSNIPLEEIEKACPACLGSCNCKVCLRADNMIKVKIREVPVLDKLQYLYCLLSSVLPVVKKIHQQQCFEVELEKRLRGAGTDLVRAKLNADEQMCCNICRIPIIDYHRHCANCSYDMCLTCCWDLRGAVIGNVRGEVAENETGGRSQDKETALEKMEVFKRKLCLSEKFPGWKANRDGSIPCPPKEYGGCSYSSLKLGRIFKMNWVAKLVKNVEEMVNGCKINDAGISQKTGLNDPRLCQFAQREASDDNFLYCPSSEDIRTEGISDFRKHWARGEPVIVKQVCDSSSMSSWDPMVIWRGIGETADEKMKDEDRIVKAVDCLNWSEFDIELGQFIEGYSEGRVNDNGLLAMLKLKDWPSPGASEEFLLYQRPEFISKLPLLEYIHSRLGLLNVAAKLPHYSLQNDVGPKISISYGRHEELGRGDSVTNLHFNMRDMVYLLVHTCEVKPKGSQKTKTDQIQKSCEESEINESSGDPETDINKAMLPHLSLGGDDIENEGETKSAADGDEKMEDQGIEIVSTCEDKSVNCEQLSRANGNIPAEAHPGAQWDVFRRQDVPKLVKYLQVHWTDVGRVECVTNDFVTCPLYDEAIFLNEHHKRQLKEEFGVEPWSFEQHLGQAVFVPAGCPFQLRNLQSTVQLGLDFLFPESVGEASRLAEEMRCLSNDHEAKLQILEVGKISLYAASSAIKEVQKLVLDSKLGAELGLEDPNLTASVSENLEKLMKQRQITCA